MPNSLEALRGLSANDPISLRMMQQKRLDEMKRNRELAAMPVGPSTQYSFGGPKLGPATFGTGATDTDIRGLESDLEEDPSTGQDEQDRIARIQNTNDELVDYSRPERVQQRQDALQRVLAPIREKGRFDVEAAQAAWGGKSELADQNNTARLGLEQTKQQSMSERAMRDQRAITLRQERNALVNNKAKANLGWGSWLGGTSQKDANDKRIAEIDVELSSLGPANAGQQMATPGALQPPGPETKEQRAARLAARFGY